MEKGIRAFVPEHLCKFLQPGTVGEILLVTSSGIYLRMDERILLLCDADWGVLPIGIGIENFPDALAQLRPLQGQYVLVTEKQLTLPTGSILLMPQHPQNKEMEGCTPQIPYIRQAAEALAALRKQRGFSMLVIPLVLGDSMDDAVKQNPYCVLAYTQLSKLMAALSQGATGEIGNCVEKLLGLGFGLTPSADDVLLGMLWIFYTLSAQHMELATVFRGCITQLCEQRTNQISTAYLKAISAGAPFERMESVYRGLCGKEPLNIHPLVEIGSSSGSEMLLGMLIALRIYGYDPS
ncbi:MAG: DUF2877 domain-containing protein [Oscillospiraceae bacterium]|nr:DUF2877 domain-containing protein [Oscillospiraceae bacterium]